MVLNISNSPDYDKKFLKIIEQISKEENALKFSKKSEEIKALFYIKIKEK